jgi:hypothetical protein
VHLNRDRFRMLIGYVDIHRLVSSGRVDWDLFWDYARLEGLDEVALEILKAVEMVLPLEVALPTRPRASLRAYVWRLAWSQSTRLTGRSGRYRFGRRAQILLPFLCKGRVIDALGLLLRRLVPSRELLLFKHEDLSDGPYLPLLFRARWRHRMEQMAARKRADL